MYVDDLVIFIAPSEQDFLLVRVLEIFAAASGLRTNLGKCQITPIQCSGKPVELAKQFFPCQLSQFPCRYLGIPLFVYQLKKADLQPF
jgi:hypothetical protein